MNDVSGNAPSALAASAASDTAAATPAPARAAKLRPLRILVPYATRYRGRIALAFVALLVASMATLVVPIAVRRMIDFGFDKIALIGAVALIVIGPERLPKVARTVGHFVGKAQRYVAEVKAEVNRSIESYP